jgi:REP element-mobilizing transposase RayT
MKYNPDLHHRHSIRLRNYDYANEGAYFVTICCQNRINRFGEIVNNADNMVGAGSACPIVKHGLPTRNDLYIAKRGAGQKLDATGQADPAPTVNTVYTMNLNGFGKIVDAEWQNLTTKYPNVNIGEYIVMPNHFHGIIEITERTVAIGNIIGYFKYKTTKMIDLPEKLWQRNYWEHIIRSEADYARIAEYIRNNPVLWGKKHLGEILPVQ